jgi:hypothetical protein
VRIISKFRDYYDSVQAHGQDPTLVYRRTTQEFAPQPHLFRHGDLYRIAISAPHSHRWQVFGWLVVFCGRLYPVWKCEEHWCLDANEVALYLHDYWARNPKSYYPGSDDFEETGRYRLDIHGHRTRLGVCRVDIDGFLRQFSGFQVGPSIHQEFGAPVLLVCCMSDWSSEEIKVVANPRLQELRFFTKVEPYTAYQEIAMYLGNELAQPDIAPQAVGDDETLARAKGFDEQSFRTKAPGNKKLNRKANKARKRQGP